MIKNSTLYIVAVCVISLGCSVKLSAAPSLSSDFAQTSNTSISNNIQVSELNTTDVLIVSMLDDEVTSETPSAKRAKAKRSSGLYLSVGISVVIVFLAIIFL